MNYVGIDLHKKDSVLCAQDERGRKLREARVEAKSGQEYARFFQSLEGPSKAVLEACWNWGLTHDLLEEIEEVEEVVLAHPFKTRLIADAQIKTDRLDTYALGTLLRGNLVARAHIPRQETRARKNLLRQRLSWARLRTMLRNRIHALLDRQHELELPQCSDIFGVRGLGFLRRLELAEPDQTLLGEALALHDLIAQQMKAQEKRIAREFKLHPHYERLLSVPGIGSTLEERARGQSLLSTLAGTTASDYPKNITVSTTTTGAHLRYTTDGTTPSETNGTLINATSGAASVAVGKTLKAIGLKTGSTDSAIQSGAYTQAASVATPTFNPVAGGYKSQGLILGQS